MTPSQFIESKAEEIFKLIGAASSRLVIALVKRRLGVAALTDISAALEKAAAESRVLLQYMRTIKEK